MLKDVVDLPGLHRETNCAGVLGLTRNNRVSRFSLPAEESMWAGASDDSSSVDTSMEMAAPTVAGLMT